MFLRFFILFVLTGFLFNLANIKTISGSEPTGESRGEKLFKANCAGCHMNGKNLIKPDKPIIGSKKLVTKEKFQTFIEAPIPPMPNFKNITSRPEELNALYNYVISLMGN